MASPRNYIKGQLAGKGITQAQIAQWSGEDEATVSHVIAGKRTNRAPVVLREICKATGLIYGDILRMYDLDRKEAA